MLIEPKHLDPEDVETLTALQKLLQPVVTIIDVEQVFAVVRNVLTQRKNSNSNSSRLFQDLLATQEENRRLKIEMFTPQAPLLQQMARLADQIYELAGDLDPDVYGRHD